jgi:hypothetical protein
LQIPANVEDVRFVNGLTPPELQAITPVSSTPPTTTAMIELKMNA